MFKEHGTWSHVSHGILNYCHNFTVLQKVLRIIYKTCGPQITYRPITVLLTSCLFYPGFTLDPANVATLSHFKLPNQEKQMCFHPLTIILAVYSHNFS